MNELTHPDFPVYPHIVSGLRYESRKQLGNEVITEVWINVFHAVYDEIPRTHQLFSPLYTIQPK